MKLFSFAFAATMLSACSLNPPVNGNDSFDNEAYTPTGSLIPRKGPDKAAKQNVLSGEAARDALDRIPAALPGR